MSGPQDNFICQLLMVRLYVGVESSTLLRIHPGRGETLFQSAHNAVNLMQVDLDHTITIPVKQGRGDDVWKTASVAVQARYTLSCIVVSTVTAIQRLFPVSVLMAHMHINHYIGH